METQIIKAEDFGLEAQKANELTIGLDIVKAERKLLIEEFKEVSVLEVNDENIPKFKNLRLRIVKNRTQGVNKWHKANKEFFLTGGKFVDAIKNKENHINEEMESKLLDAEKHFENLEKERVEKLNNERIKLVSPYLEEVENLQLAYMEQDVFEAYLLTKKQNYEAILKADEEREEARLKAIEDEKAEQERVRVENAKLKAEAEKKEKALEKEREVAKNKQQAIELKAKKEREVAEAKIEELRKAQAIKDAKLKAENDAKLKKEADAKAKIESELQAVKNAQEKAKKEAELKLQSELNKGDADKIKDLINDFELLKTKYVFESDKNKKLYNNVGSLIDKINKYITT